MVAIAITFLSALSEIYAYGKGFYEDLQKKSGKLAVTIPACSKVSFLNLSGIHGDTSTHLRRLAGLFIDIAIIEDIVHCNDIDF